MSPDGSTKPPPEEKLLKLIRGKEPQLQEASVSSVAATAATRLIVLSDLRAWPRRTQWMTLVRGVFGLVFVVEVLCLVAQAMRPLPTINVPRVNMPPPTEPLGAEVLAPNLPSLAASAPRALFASPGTPTTTLSSESPAKTAMPSESARLLAARLTLMGIVAGEPSQAIIEDSQTKKNYFVTPGQAVVDGAILEHVLDNRVILNLDGEKIELTL